MSDLKSRLLDLVKEDLERIESALEYHLTTNFDLVSNVASHTLFSGGKRLRPLLLILSARICGYEGEDDVKFATSLEYLHTATLLHDDLVDGASLRRGKPVANFVWDNTTAVLVGDFLFARASSIAAKTKSLDAIEILAFVTEEMSQGELYQLIKKGNLKLTEAEYLEVIRRKTAVLFEGACRLGAAVADSASEKKEALTQYGYNLGMAFQMADDLLDYIQQDLGTLGKKAGADLREGKVTLPVIYTLTQSTPKDRELIESIIANKEFSFEEFKTLIHLMETYGGLEYTRKEALSYVHKAKDALSIFPSSQTRDILSGFADYALVRKA